jgi:hypothetical protein
MPQRVQKGTILASEKKIMKLYNMTTTGLWTRATLLLCAVILCFCTHLTHQPALGKTIDTPKFEIQQRTIKPLLQADKPWEANGISGCTVLRDGTRWRMWYCAWRPDVKRDNDSFFCYAESADGLHWTKPDLGLTEYAGSTNNNIIFSCSQINGLPNYIFIDTHSGPSRQYKMIVTRFNEQKQAWWIYGGTSADGIHWAILPEPLCPQNSDTQTACIPEANKYRLYTRMWTGILWSAPGKRLVGYTQSDHFGDFPNPRAILSPDDQYPQDMDFYSNAAAKLSDNLYVMFPGGFYRTDQTIHAYLAWSCDGAHFTRYGRTPVIDLGRDFDSGMLLVSPCAIPADKPNTWWIYYYGTARRHNQSLAQTHYAGIGRFLLVVQ